MQSSTWASLDKRRNYQMRSFSSLSSYLSSCAEQLDRDEKLRISQFCSVNLSAGSGTCVTTSVGSSQPLKPALIVVGAFDECYNPDNASTETFGAIVARFTVVPILAPPCHQSDRVLVFQEDFHSRPNYRCCPPRGHRAISRQPWYLEVEMCRG